MAKATASSVARQLFRAGRWEDAERAARKAWKQDPGFSAEAAAIAGIAALRLGRHEDAARALSFATRGAPRSSSLWLALAEASVAIGEHQAADEALLNAVEAGATPRDVAELRGASRRARLELPTSNAWGAASRGEETTPGQWEAVIAGLLRARMPQRARQLLTEAPPGAERERVLLSTARVAAMQMDAVSTRESYALAVRRDAALAGEAFVAMLGIGDFVSAEEYAELEHRKTGQPRCHALLATYRGEYDVARAHAARVPDPSERRSISVAIALAEGHVEDVYASLAGAPRTPVEDLIYLDVLWRLGKSAEAVEQFGRLDSSATPDIAAAPLVMLTHRSATTMRPEDHELFRALRSDFPHLGDIDTPHAFARAALAELSGNWSRCATRRLANGTIGAQRISRPIRERVAGLRQALGSLPLAEVIALHDELEMEHGPHPLIDTYRSELELWRGDYVTAAARFALALERDVHTRWAYVGLATCQLLQGAPEKVVGTLDEQRRWMKPMPNGLGCVAEAQLRMGRVVEAEDTYRKALAAHPTRVSAWLGLGLVGVMRGVTMLVDESHERVRALTPTFFAQWQHEAGTRETRARLEHALAMMRGNRSSRFVTWWTADGALHGEDVVDPLS